MTRPANEQISTDNLPEPQVKHTQSQSVEIVDPVFEETYTAHVTKKLSKWHGWIPNVPEVKCEAKTKTELLKTLIAKLREALEAREETWDKQLEEDIKAGKLDHLREEALEDIKAGRVSDL
jgi:predicted metal-dependent hydrolase